jgi:hypothetical protein
MLWRVAEKVEPVLKSAYQAIFRPPVPNLRGDRDLEYTWVAANIPDGPGKALDFGSGPSWLGLLAARKGFDVTALDLTDVAWFYEYPGLRFVKGDIFNLKFSSEHFDLLINCSAIEHVGLCGRYGVVDVRPDGDIEVMEILSGILKREGIMLLTIPVGCDRVFSSLHRVYGQNRLPRLLKKYEIIKKEFWVKDDFNIWRNTDEETALSKEPLAYCYGLGLFVLRPSPV